MKPTASYPGGVFCDHIEGGRAGADIELRDAGIVATTTDGEQFLVPYAECQVEIGGFSGRMVFCRNRDRSVTIFTEDRAFAEDLSRAAAGLLSAAVSEKLSRRRADIWRGWRLAVALTVVGVLVVVGAWWGLRRGARALVHALPMSVDAKIGTLAYQSMHMEGPELRDPVVTQAVRAMIDRLKPHAAIPDIPYQLHIIDAPIVNAFALPGGTIVVFTGLLAKAQSAEQVAGVLAHEMSHVTLRHGLERVADSANVMLVVQLVVGDAQGLITLGAQLFTLASVSRYSRQQETAADDEGVRMLHAARIRPDGLADFLAILDETHGDVPDAVAWISSHPQNKQRIARIREQTAGLDGPPYEPLPIDWMAVQQRVAPRNDNP